MNKPVYLGQAILDLSKTPLYEFHYDYMRPKYGSKVKTALFMRYSPKIFTETLQKMWRKGLIRVDTQGMIACHYPSEKIKR